MFPNTTQIPNNLFNGEMQKMKDTELRITLIIARKTLGWLENIETGMRKEEDWIARSQLIYFTNRGHNAVSSAITNCIKNKWIEARNEKGEILDTPQKRKEIGQGGKIYYRLGKIFLSNIKESQKRTAKKGQQKEDTTKETIYTKETDIQNTNSDSKNRPLKRKDFKMPIGVYKELTDAYQKYKSIELKGAEFGQVKQAIKTIIYSGRTKEDILKFMNFCAEVCERINEGDEGLEKKLGWLQNWTILTIKRKMPEFLGGRFRIEDEELEIPSYAKKVEDKN